MARKKWEYQYLEYKIDLVKMRKAKENLKTEIEKILNALGEEGWEIVNIHEGTSVVSGFERIPIEMILQVTAKREKEKIFSS